MTLLRISMLGALPLALFACAGSPMFTPIEGEPMCADFELGAARTKMAGSLRTPVEVRIKDGDKIVYKALVIGRRSEADKPARIFLVDDNRDYTVEWVQCDNVRAAQEIGVTSRPGSEKLAYECGDGQVYKTETLTTKKGDPKSHTLTFPTPPKPECWVGEPPAEQADAGAPDAAEDAATEADTGAPDPDAGDSDAGDAGDSDAGDAGAAPSATAAATAAPTASATPTTTAKADAPTVAPKATLTPKTTAPVKGPATTPPIIPKDEYE